MNFGTKLTSLAIAFALVGCASGGQEEKRANNAERERTFHFQGGEQLAKTASFDLSCPVEQMEAFVLQRIGMFQVATKVGVHGCGKKTSYLRSAGTSGTWVIASDVVQYVGP